VSRFQTPELERDLRALVFQAFEFRGSPYLHDAVEAIVDRYQREPLAAFERQQERQARILRLLRTTSPELFGLRRAA
jgi:hypothetical protein